MRPAAKLVKSGDMSTHLLRESEKGRPSTAPPALPTTGGVDPLTHCGAVYATMKPFGGSVRLFFGPAVAVDAAARMRKRSYEIGRDEFSRKSCAF